MNLCHTLREKGANGEKNGTVCSGPNCLCPECNSDSDGKIHSSNTYYIGCWFS